MDRNLLYRQLQQAPEYNRYLFRYGYLITDCQFDLRTELPSLQNWSMRSLGNYSIWLHPEQKVFFYTNSSTIHFIIGHCYNPFTLEYLEENILSQLSNALEKGIDVYHQAISDLTGIFLLGYVKGNTLTVYGDATGMFMTYYGFYKEHLYLSSHAQLLGDLCKLEQSPYIQTLVNYRYYPLFGIMLPGDLSPYNLFRRLVPNHYATFSDHTVRIVRFYPTENWDDLVHRCSIEHRVQSIAEILQNTMTLIPRKWKRPAISLTGGCDSKTTLACAVQNYDHYQYFSYISQDTERIDADGANKICNTLGLSHQIYKIPENNHDLVQYDLQRSIIACNTGNIGFIRDNEVRKRIFLAELDDFDVEVKSWCSEIARAYYCKRFAKKHFPHKPNARYLTSLYKIFLNNRKLVHETDAIFNSYLHQYMSFDQLNNWPWIDLFFWEFRVSSWNGLVITGEQKYAFDITIPYNNRHLLEYMLTVPQDLRINDGIYRLVRNISNPQVDQAGVSITNVMHTSRRAKLERAYLELHSRFPL